MPTTSWLPLGAFATFPPLSNDQIPEGHAAMIFDLTWPIAMTEGGVFVVFEPFQPIADNDGQLRTFADSREHETMTLARRLLDEGCCQDILMCD